MMTPERRVQIEEIFQAALDCARRRAPFPEEKCGGAGRVYATKLKSSHPESAGEKDETKSNTNLKIKKPCRLRRGFCF